MKKKEKKEIQVEFWGFRRGHIGEQNPKRKWRKGDEYREAIFTVHEPKNSVINDNGSQY